MFRRTTQDVWAVCHRLRIRGPSALLSYDTAHCLHFFGQFVDQLKAEVESLDAVIDEECRQLLDTAVSHAFSLIAHLKPSFKLARLLGPIPPDHQESFLNSVRKDVKAFVEAFGPQAKRDAEGQDEDDTE